MSPERIPRNGIPIARPIPTSAMPVQIFPQMLPIFSITSSSFILTNLYMCYVEQLLDLLASHQLGHFSYVMSKRIRRVSSSGCKFFPCGHGSFSVVLNLIGLKTRILVYFSAVIITIVIIISSTVSYCCTCE